MLTHLALPIEFNLSLDTDKFEEFIHLYDKWIHSSEQTVKGLPKDKFIVSGITDALNQLYGLYNKIGVFNGEYGYHELTIGNRITHDFDEANCIVISHPFSANGESSHHLLEIADTYNKPIFVDCAFFGVCHNINFDFSKYKNIHSVCFSLSKVFGTGLNRVGMLYTKDKFPVTVYQEWKYPLITQAIQHHHLIQTKTPDDACKTYKKKQIEICKSLKLQPSSTIIFGISNSDTYKKYKRGNYNRVCISALLNENVQKVYQKYK